MIVCLECKQMFKIISPSHLKHKHNMTVKEYRNKFPNCETGYETMCETQKITNLKRYGVENVSYLNSVKKKIVEQNIGTKKSLLSRSKMSNSHKGKVLTEEHKRNISKNGRITINKIKKKYPIFYKEEDMQYNPDKPDEKEIQVHCKNHNCNNSKEHNGWFVPTKSQLSERIRQLESKNGNGASYFYCSEKCKLDCILYNKRVDYILKENMENDFPYTQEEYETWRNQVKELDNSKCQICGTKENIHVHHIIPQKLQPFFVLDPVNGICLCKNCHFKYGHSGSCSTGNLATLTCQ